MADERLVLITMKSVFGNGIFLSGMAIFILQSFNFMYACAGGIRKLDAYFEDGKNYDDTWSIAAGCRFIDYSNRFILGKLKVKSLGLRCWMYWNAVGCIVTYLYFVVFFSIRIYLWLFA